MADLRDLARWCDALPGRIEREASKLAVETVRTMAADLIAHTPVDITTAVSNWQTSLNTAVMFDLPAIYPGSRGSTAPASRTAALAHVVRGMGNKQPGEKIYLSNLTPYIIDLNNGSSKQEPAGFVERGVLVGELFASRATFKV